jgi:hypothetical protein
VKKILLLLLVLLALCVGAVANAGPHDIWPPITVDEVRTSGPGPF